MRQAAQGVTAHLFFALDGSAVSDRQSGAHGANQRRPLMASATSRGEGADDTSGTEIKGEPAACVVYTAQACRTNRKKEDGMSSALRTWTRVCDAAHQSKHIAGIGKLYFGACSIKVRAGGASDRAGHEGEGALHPVAKGGHGAAAVGLLDAAANDWVAPDDALAGNAVQDLRAHEAVSDDRERR